MVLTLIQLIMENMKEKEEFFDAKLAEFQQMFACEVMKRLNSKGWNQDRFVFESGISQATVSNVLNGKNNLTYKMMIKFIHALDTTFKRFFSAACFNQRLK
jgi:antitoxin component HigA of HigAB toxin-antitoxin module